MTRPGLVDRLAVIAVAAAVAATALIVTMPPASAASAAGQPVAWRVIEDRTVTGRVITTAGLPRPPELAATPADHTRLWEGFGFTTLDGILIPAPPPPPPPQVEFPREVAIYLGNDRAYDDTLDGITRQAGQLVLDFSYSTGPGRVTTGETFYYPTVLAVERDQLPGSPFELVQRENGQVTASTTVDLGDRELPRTGPRHPLRRLGALALLLLATGTLLVDHTRAGPYPAPVRGVHPMLHR
ncbi:MAG TPA: hypothetical protein VGA36_09815 [Nitriliruptorales bacterium]